MKKILCLAVFLLLVGVCYAYTEQQALDKIDWQNIKDGTIVLLVKDWKFNFVSFIDFNQDPGWKLLVPSKEELFQFLEYYDFENITIEKDGKTVFVLKENQTRPFPVIDVLNLLSPELQSAAMNLSDTYPSCFILENPSSSQCGEGEKLCGDSCCDINGECSVYEGHYSCLV